MKKRILLILMVLVLIAAFPLMGCENSFKRAKLSEAQDTSYTVKGNGGNAVSYGNFIYFINGYRGYEDTDGKNNVWGNVIKGALYRVKLLGTKDGSDFIKEFDSFSGLAFDSEPFVIDKNGFEYYLSEKEFTDIKTDSITIETDLNYALVDDDDYEPDIVEETFYPEDLRFNVTNVELVASKVIGTSGYAEGGIFIFDNYVYYASPNNQRDKSGNIQTNKTDFFRTDINGTKTERIYTTSSESSSSPYGFYKQGNYTYLVVLDGTNIVSVKMNSKKVLDKVIIADNATDAYFPVKDQYNKSNNPTDSVEDFVYYTRAVEKEDGIFSGNAIEVVRPNGKDRFELVKNGRSSTIEAVRDGLVFYRTTDQFSREVLRYTNMHSSLEEFNENGSPYSELVAGIALGEISTDYTSLYVFRPNAHIDETDNFIVVLGFSSSAVYLVDDTSRVKIVNEQAVAPIIHGNTLYYSDTSAIYKSANIYTEFSSNTPMVIEEQGASGSVIVNSVVDDFFVFMGTVDTYANAYAKFYPINGDDTIKSNFVGERIEADMKEKP